MIERAERYVSAQEVRPGDRVVVDGHHIDVETVSLRAEDVVLTGVPVGRTSGSKRKVHVTVAHKTSVTVLADSDTLDLIEARVAAVLAEALNGMIIEDGVFQVLDDHEEEWHVPLRPGSGAKVIDLPSSSDADSETG